jgi:hypothetical protein
LSKGDNIVKWIKGQRISWLGHLERMEEDRMPRKIFTQELEGTRRRGRPWKGWREEVKRDLQVLGVYYPKHVEQFPDINKLCNVTSCWIYIGILLGAHPILHISRIKVNVDVNSTYSYHLGLPAIQSIVVTICTICLISPEFYIFYTRFLLHFPYQNRQVVFVLKEECFL